MADRKLHNLKAFHQIFVLIHVSGLYKSLNLLTELISLVALNSVQSSCLSFFISPSPICESLSFQRLSGKTVNHVCRVFVALRGIRPHLCA